MGRQPIPLRQIAIHAGVSDATVDRVLHDRGGVRDTTVARVKRAITELEEQHALFEFAGRTFTVDLVMIAPHRFTSAVWDAFEAAIPALRPAVFRIRPHMHERIESTHLIRTLDKIATRGTQAIILKAPELPEVVDAVNRLADQGVPIITIVTDLPTSNRVAYVGIDNRAAGATAAYLISQWLPTRPDNNDTANVLVTLSSQHFRGEEERGIGFRNTARAVAPGWRTFQLTETQGLDATITAQLDDIADTRTIDAVYSIGGGNHATLATLERHNQRPDIYIAHDLDSDNRQLLSAGKISAVLHHDLTTDASRACQLIMQAHGATPGRPTTQPTPIQIITPYNTPTQQD